MSETKRYNTGPGDIIDQIKDLQKRIQILETNPRISNSSIDYNGLDVLQGNIRIVDASGNIRIKMGKLDDGSYDITAYDQMPSTDTVNLAQLAFGQHAVFDTTTCTSPINSVSYADPNSGTFGPQIVGVRIGSSGRCKVTISAHFDYQVLTTVPQNDGQLLMSVAITGATTVNPSDDTALQEYTAVSPTTVQLHRTISFSRVHLYTGLNTGLHTFTMKYAAAVTVGSTLTHGFSDRALFVEPF